MDDAGNRVWEHNPGRQTSRRYSGSEGVVALIGIGA